jgi:2-phosphoglycerate kinase
MQKYLEAMDSIRALQERIVDRAAAYHVPVIESSDIERASGALLEEVFRAAVQLDPVGEAARRSAQPLR